MKKQIIRKCCCENFPRYLSSDLRQYISDNKPEAVSAFTIFIWLLLSTGMFISALSIDSRPVWIIFGLVSFGIPMTLTSIIFTLTMVLYSYQCYQRTEEELNKENHPGLQLETWICDGDGDGDDVVVDWSI